MPDDINNLDTKDEGLKGIFGERFHDLSVAEACKSRNNKPATTNTAKAVQKPAETAGKAKCEPAKPAPDWMARLKACAIWASGFGSLNFLIFYWQLAGLMDESIAIPCMWVCMALAGFGIGKSASGRVR